MYKIYRLTSPSSKIYIGFTKQDMDRRFKQHIRRWKTGHITKLTSAFKKYDPAQWQIDILAVAPDVKSARMLEIAFIKYFNTILFGYNITIGGEGGHDFKYNVSNITKNKISKANKGRPNKYKGVPRTDETKRKLSIANKGRKFPGRKTITTWRPGHKPWNKSIALSETQLINHREKCGKLCTDGSVVFTSITEMALHYSTRRETMLYRINSQSQKFHNFRFC